MTPNEVVYQIFTGDFFIKKDSTDFIERSRLFFDSTTPTKATSKIFYDKFTGSFFAGTGSSSHGHEMERSLASGISGTFPNASFNQFDYFLNGQKLYSGDGVQENTYGASSWIPNFVDGQGVVTSENESSFKATAYWKTNRIQEITGAQPDVIGIPFIEGQTKFYINGIKEDSSCYLELYSGVNLIETGVGVALNRLTAANTTNHYLSL